jgi:hypothetical protein
MARDWTAELEARERQWLDAVRKARARRREASALALAALLTVFAILARCRGPISYQEAS